MDSKKEKSNIYDMQGALKASPWRSQQLYAVLFAPIQNFSVEFTEIPDAPLKNHVVFKLDFATPIARRDFTVAMPFGTNKGGSVASGNFESLPGNQDISCVYVSINLSESGTNNGTSSIQIRLATPTPTNQAAAASFQFDLDPKPHIPITLWDMLEAIQGTHPDLPRCMASDLTKFAFRSQGFLPSWDCTRDWM